MVSRFQFCFWLFALVLLSGCSETQRNGDGTYLARVGSSYLTVDMARRAIPDFAYRTDSLQALASYRDQWIKEQVLLNEAQSLRLADREQVQRRLQKSHNQVLINALQDVILAEYQSQLKVSDREALRYYREHQKQLKLDERYVRFRHISNADLGAVRRARTQLQNDSTWSRVAREFSVNASEKINRADRFWPLSAVFNDLPIMKRYVATLDSGQISPIQRHEGLYHMVQLTGVREQGSTADPQWFIDEVKQWLIHEKRRKYYNSYVKNLYFSAKENNEMEVYNVTTPNIND